VSRKFSAIHAIETVAGRNWLMDAVQTDKPPESLTHVTFETAAEHATARVPVWLRESC
jgi:hypothetical protein